MPDCDTWLVDELLFLDGEQFDEWEELDELDELDDPEEPSSKNGLIFSAIKISSISSSVFPTVFNVILRPNEFPSVLFLRSETSQSLPLRKTS